MKSTLTLLLLGLLIASTVVHAFKHEEDEIFIDLESELEAEDDPCESQGGECISGETCLGAQRDFFIDGKYCQNGLTCCIKQQLPQQQPQASQGGPMTAGAGPMVAGATASESFSPPSNNLGITLPSPLNFTAAFMQCIGVPADNAASYASALSQTVTRFGITEPSVLASFLGNCGEESDGWSTTVEASNTDCLRYSDGGCTYKGRGIIQLTHQENYAAAGNYFGQPFVANPDLAAQMPWAFLTAGWYWSSNGITNTCFHNSNHATLLCAQECAAALINGYFSNSTDMCGLRAPNGWAERQLLTVTAQQCLLQYFGGSNSTNLQGQAFGDPCGPTGNGFCGYAGTLPASSYASGFCPGNFVCILNGVSAAPTARDVADGALCGPGDVQGYGTCVPAASQGTTCVNGYWSGYCAQGPSVCCKGIAPASEDEEYY